MSKLIILSILFSVSLSYAKTAKVNKVSDQYVSHAETSECASVRCKLNSECKVEWTRVSDFDGGRWCTVTTDKKGGFSCNSKRDDGSCPSNNCQHCQVTH